MHNDPSTGVWDLVASLGLRSLRWLVLCISKCGSRDPVVLAALRGHIHIVSSREERVGGW